MALKQYNLKINDDGDMYWALPSKVTLPSESYKYISTPWNDSDYTWNRLSYMVYGTSDYYWLLLAANNITNPYAVRNGKKIKILLPQYLNEVKVNDG